MITFIIFVLFLISTTYYVRFTLAVFDIADKLKVLDYQKKAEFSEFSEMSGFQLSSNYFFVNRVLGFRRSEALDLKLASLIVRAKAFYLRAIFISLFWFLLFIVRVEFFK